MDIATYKAEFLSHYYERKTRPLHAYAFGMIDKWAQWASHAPRIANVFSHAPGLSLLLRKILSLARERQLPQLAHVTFREWARRNDIPGLEEEIGNESKATSGKSREVILWADTFNNYFYPETAIAATEVLRDAGFTVRTSRQHLCCGRPLYDFGMLDRAKMYLQRAMQALGEQIDLGLPIVVLEPSCASVFRDELGNLFPKDERANRLRGQIFLLSEFLERHAPDYHPPRLSRKVLLHGHCHQKALMKMSHEEALLRNMGAELQLIDSGCCGLAGPFGFEKDKYAISQAIGERVLLPAVRQSSEDTLIVSDGFSCREQILQATGRRAVHLAEAMQLAKRQQETRGL